MKHESSRIWKQKRKKRGKALPSRAFVQLVEQKSHASPHSSLDQRSYLAREERRKAVTAAAAADSRNKTNIALCSRQNTDVVSPCCLVHTLEA